MIRDFLGDELKNKCSSKLIEIVTYFSNKFNYNIGKYVLEKMLNTNLRSFEIGLYKRDREEFEYLINEYNLDLTTFLDYLFDNLPYQGIRRIDYYNFLSDYSDYLKNSKLVYGKVRNKYPDYFKTEHDKISMLYEINKTEYEEKQAKESLAKALQYEYLEKEYSIIAPKSTQDIVNEGISLHHCVATYVPRVISGEKTIMFLRETNKIDESLITISINKDNIIDQVRGLSQIKPSEEQWLAIERWAKKFKLELDRKFT